MARGQKLARGTSAAQRTARQRWERDVTQFHAENGGLLTIELLRPEAIWRYPERVIPLLVNWHRQAVASPAGMLCLICDTDLQPPAMPMALVVASSASETPAQKGLVSGICAQCAGRSTAELMPEALAQLRKLWPDLRAVERANLHMTGEGRA